jgi:TPR repeat protein
MAVNEREVAAIARLRPRAIAGDSVAVSNIAAGYRILGRWRLAFRWWARGAAAGDGGDMLEAAYCYHHGLGVRRNVAAARRLYERAIQSRTISQFEHEEAMYHLAVLLLQISRNDAARARARKLLRDANVDRDYPQAATLHASVSTHGQELCVCRRRLRPGVGRVACSLHRGTLPNKALHRTSSLRRSARAGSRR